MAVDCEPGTAAEVAAIVEDAFATRRPLEIAGYGSKSTLGNRVDAAARLKVNRLDDIILYEPDEQVLCVGAGASLHRITDELLKNRQRLAFSPPDWRALLGSVAEEQSIGGIVATNLSGSRRLTAGAARDHVIGITAVNGRGEAFKSGGRVVKNVTGYDLCKLIAGSFGTLAVLTSVTFRLVPMAESEKTLVLYESDPATAVLLFASALGCPSDVSAAAWLPASLSPAVGLSGAVALLRLEGLEESLVERTEYLEGPIGRAYDVLPPSESSSLWRMLGDVVPFQSLESEAIWRISLPPSDGPGLLDLVPDARGWLDWAGGLVWLAVPETGDLFASRIRPYVAKHGGHSTLLRASEEFRSSIPIFQPRPRALATLYARIRASFDPAGILNPGRMFIESTHAN